MHKEQQAMKINVIVTILLHASLYCPAQNKNLDSKSEVFGVFNFFEDDIIKARLNEVSRRDSTSSLFEGLIFRSFDNLDTLIQELRYALAQSDLREAYLLRNVYDKKGRVILYELFNAYGQVLERFKYNYDANGQVTRKEIKSPAKN